MEWTDEEHSNTKLKLELQTWKGKLLGWLGTPLYLHTFLGALGPLSERQL